MPTIQSEKFKETTFRLRTLIFGQTVVLALLKHKLDSRITGQVRTYVLVYMWFMVWFNPYMHMYMIEQKCFFTK